MHMGIAVLNDEGEKLMVSEDWAIEPGFVEVDGKLELIEISIVPRNDSK